MNRVEGCIVIRETGTGIENLLVVVYDIDIDAYIKLKSGQYGHEKLMGLGGITGDRLGSVLTDAEGQFRLEYEDEDFQLRHPEKRPDLALLVLSPDDPDVAPQNRLLYASEGVRANAGRLESFFLRISRERLVTARVLSPSVVMASTTLPQLDKVVSALREEALQRQQQVIKTPFSQRYREQRQLILEATTVNKAVRPTRSFPLSIPVEWQAAPPPAESVEPKEDGPPVQRALQYDQDRQQLLLHAEGQEVRPLEFQGIVYQLGASDVDIQSGGITLVVDLAANRYSLRLPASSTLLTVPELQPDALYRWNAEQWQNLGNNA
jgi:hypothetical protein